MSGSKRHEISAQDILDGGPVVSVLSSSSGLNGSRRFSVVTHLDNGAAFYSVEIDGEHSQFPLDELEKAVTFFNEG